MKVKILLFLLLISALLTWWASEYDNYSLATLILVIILNIVEWSNYK